MFEDVIKKLQDNLMEIFQTYERFINKKYNNYNNNNYI